MHAFRYNIKWNLVVGASGSFSVYRCRETLFIAMKNLPLSPKSRLSSRSECRQRTNRMLGFIKTSSPTFFFLTQHICSSQAAWNWARRREPFTVHHFPPQQTKAFCFQNCPKTLLEESSWIGNGPGLHCCCTKFTFSNLTQASREGGSNAQKRNSRVVNNLCEGPC